jgi:acyl-CoA synthetase (AMP-forming)/AMP-acid ligase II
MSILLHQLFQSENINADELAINDLSWGDLSHSIQKFYKELNLCQSGIVLLKIPNTPEGLALLLASSFLNLTTIVVPSYYNEAFIQNVIDAYQVNHYVTLDHGKFCCQLKHAETVNLNNGATLCLLSSGTTGTPKCIQHSWETLIARIQVQEKYKGCAWFSGYPISHFAGIQVALQCLYNGGHLILPSSYDAGTSLQAIAYYKPHYLNCTPTYMRQLFLSQSEMDWSVCGLKRITLGGEIVDQDIIDLIRKTIPGVGVTHIYASTELGVLISVNDEKEGFPLELIDDQKFSIIDDSLWVKPGTSTMLSYLNQTPLRELEWVHTKDLVMVKGNRVFFVGRCDDTINIGGYKVNPTVVEQVIRQIPGVLNVAVSGKKNSIMGNIIKASIQMDRNAEYVISNKEIIHYCKTYLPDYMVPRIIEWVDKLKMTPTNKLLRRE